MRPSESCRASNCARKAEAHSCRVCHSNNPAAAHWEAAYTAANTQISARMPKQETAATAANTNSLGSSWLKEKASARSCIRKISVR